MNAALHRLARWGAALDFAQLPDAVVEAAKTQLLSTLASVHAGYRSDLGQPIRNAFGLEGSGAHAIPAGISTAPAPNGKRGRGSAGGACPLTLMLSMRTGGT